MANLILKRKASFVLKFFYSSNTLKLALGSESSIRNKGQALFHSTTTTPSSSLKLDKMDLKIVVRRLQEYAPLPLACDWDNVGLLVEPTDALVVKKILVTNDLTEPVLEEAIKKNANLIVSYHPAIFHPLKRLTQADWKQRTIVKCIEKRIAVYCPHTTWDSVDGGINDWILTAFGKFSSGQTSGL